MVSRASVPAPSLMPMAGPLLSIITPCLNAESTIAETLRSIQEQGLGDLVEHVVIDGGSSDGTVAILEGESGLRFVSEPDAGLSDAMNKGVALARGRFIGWLNADDYYLPGSLERIVAVIESQPLATWITAPCKIVDGEGNEIRRYVTAYKQWLLRRHRFWSLLIQNYVAAPSTFVRRDALLQLGGFDRRFKYSMDYDLWLRLARGRAPVLVDEPVAAFRMAGESLSMTGFESQFQEHSRNAREHGDGYTASVLANRMMSRIIVWVYRALRRLPGRP